MTIDEAIEHIRFNERTGCASLSEMLLVDEVERLRDQRDKTVSLLAMSCTDYHGTTCLDPDDDGRLPDISSACNVCSIRAMLTEADT